MKTDIYLQFIEYLQDELVVPQAPLEKIIKFVEQDFHLLPIALWQYELLTVHQLEQAYDWLAIAYQQQETREAS
ncbi:MAG: DUF2949 domain-containing protein [Phormidesmis sp.]